MLGRRVAGAAAGLALLTMISKLAGLVREQMVARSFGAGPEYDAYLVGYTVPEVVSFVALHVALYLFVPLYLQERGRSPESADQFASAFLLRSSFILIGLGGLTAGFAGVLVDLLAPGMEGAMRRAAIISLRILSLVILGRGLEGGFRALAHADRRFWLPTFGAMLSSVLVITILAVWAASHGVVALAVAVAIGSLLSVGIMIGPLFRKRTILAARPRFTHPLLAECARRMPFILLIEAFGLVRPLVDRVIATRVLEDGAVSALAYARILFDVPPQVLGLALSMTLFPEFATMAARSDTVAYRLLLQRGIRASVTMMVPFAVLFVVLREPTVQVFFERGVFDSTATALTADALWAYCLGLPFAVVATLCMQAAYADRRFSLLLWARGIALAVKIGSSLLLVRLLGHTGLALATSLFFVVVAVILGRTLTGGLKNLVPRPALLAMAATSCGVVAWGLAVYVDYLEVGAWGTAAGTALAWMAGLGIYGAVCRVGRLEELLWLESMIRDRLGRGLQR